MGIIIYDVRKGNLGYRATTIFSASFFFYLAVAKGLGVIFLQPVGH